LKSAQGTQRKTPLLPLASPQKGRSSEAKEMISLRPLLKRLCVLCGF
jgi:hypothetical protein